MSCVASARHLNASHGVEIRESLALSVYFSVCMAVSSASSTSEASRRACSCWSGSASRTTGLAVARAHRGGSRCSSSPLCQGAIGSSWTSGTATRQEAPSARRQPHSQELSRKVEGLLCYRFGPVETIDLFRRGSSLTISRKSHRP